MEFLLEAQKYTYYLEHSYTSEFEVGDYDYTITRRTNTFGNLLTKQPTDFDFITVPSNLQLVSGDIVYLPIVLYTDGGTFGQTSGNVKIQAGWLTDNAELANMIANAIYRGEYQEYLLSKKGKKNLIKTHAWNGYFASLDEVRIERLEVNRETYPKRLVK